MKAIVLKTFKDKQTGLIYNIGQEFKGSSERIKEINNALKGALEVQIETAPEQLVIETEKIIKKRRSKKE